MFYNAWYVIIMSCYYKLTHFYILLYIQFCCFVYLIYFLLLWSLLMAYATCLCLFEYEYEYVVWMRGGRLPLAYEQQQWGEKRNLADSVTLQLCIQCINNHRRVNRFLVVVSIYFHFVEAAHFFSPNAHIWPFVWLRLIHATIIPHWLWIEPEYY